MTTASARGSLEPGWLTKCGFAKLAGTWFGALVALYAIYALIAFSRLEPVIPGAYRAVMVLGPTMMAMALLASAATFAASAIRFDLLTERDSTRRRVYWIQLALVGLGAYLLVALGTPAVRTMLPGAGDLPTESLPSSADALSGLRLLVPVPFGVFTVLSGVAGAFVGRITSRSVLKHSGAVPWLVCFGLLGAFAASFLATSSLIVGHGFPSMWIVIAPVMIPLIVVLALVRRENSNHRRLFVRNGKTAESNPDPDSVDAVISRVIESRRTTGEPRAATTVSEEEHVAHVIRTIRHAAGSRAGMSRRQVAGIVKYLVRQDHAPTQPVTKPVQVRSARLGELCSACVSLAAGCLLVGSIGGLMPSISSAAIAGVIGTAVVSSVVPRSRRAYSST